jgi:hypothetical protein
VKLRIHYPWTELDPGEGFFIPCLDTALVREMGLRAALKLKMKNARAIPGIRDELIGVWFYLPLGASAPSTVSSSDEPHPA